MATTIVTKYGGDAPAASDIVRGELAVDTENGRLYTENAAGAVVEIGLNPAGNISKTSGDLTLDVAGNIRLDADDNGEIRYLDGGTQYAAIKKDGDNALFQSIVADGDFIIQGIDGASFVSALTLDMSDAGAATFNSKVGIGVAPATPLNVAKTGDGTIIRLLSVGIGEWDFSMGNSSTLTGVGAGALELLPLNSGTGSEFAIGQAGSSTPVFHIKGGNVGIGTSTAAQKFVVAEGTSEHGIELAPGTLSYIQAYDRATADYGDLKIDAQTLQFGTDNGQERMRIDASGNLLVGKSSLEYENTAGHIFRADGLQSSIRSGGNAADFNRLSSEGEVIRVSKDGTTVGSIGVVGTNDLVIYSSAASHTGLRLGEGYYIPTDNTGAAADNVVDLGLPTVRYKDLYLSGKIAKGTGGELDLKSDGGGFAYKQNLDVATAGCTFTGASTRGDVAAIRLWQTATGANGGYIRFDTCNSGSTTPTEKARITQEGNLLVAKTTAGAVLTHGVELSAGGAVFSTTSNAGDSSYFVNLATTGTRYLQRFYAATTFVGSITSTGTTTAYNTSSDQRLKDNIVDAPSASDDIDAIQVRSFDWKADGEHQKYGMIAQELQTVAPEAVSGNADSEEMMGVDYSKLVPMLVKEIQSLRARVAQLES